MYAVIKTGGKQYLVEPGKKLKIEKLTAQAGNPSTKLGTGNFVFEEVLLVGDDKKVEVGTPMVSGAKVEAKVVREGRARKVLVFKYHAKTRYRKKKGHRQSFTEVEIIKIG